MGCFDFVYADNGTNIRRQRGYLYLTKKFQNYTRLPNPIPFICTDDYGDFTFRVKQTNLTLDIYAIYGCMVYLDLLKHNPAKIQKLTDKDQLHSYVFLYMDILKNRDFTNNKIENLEEEIRLFGINAFYDIYYKCNRSWALYSPEPEPIETYNIIVPKLGNQKKKQLRTQERFQGNVPLLITRKKLPQNPEDDLSDIAYNWGFCTTGDPNQGCGITRNHYCIYEKEEL